MKCFHVRLEGMHNYSAVIENDLLDITKQLYLISLYGLFCQLNFLVIMAYWGETLIID